nr:GntR family transcriptional regulator [Candidatus Pantoea persica]
MPLEREEQESQSSRYRQIAEQIKQAIHSGSLPPDSRLPSVRTLTARFIRSKRSGC